PGAGWANREARRWRAGTGYRTWRWTGLPGGQAGHDRPTETGWAAQRVGHPKDSLPQRRQLVGLEFLTQRFDDLLHRAGHDFRQGIQGQVDAVIGDPALGKVVGADALGAVARTDQQLATVGDFLVGRGVLLVLQLGRQPGHGLGAVLVLRALFLAFDHDAGGQVGDADGRFGLVDVLATGAGGAIGVHAQVGRVDLDGVLLIRLGQHRHGAGRGVDA